MQTVELQNRHGQKIVGDVERPEGDIRGTCIVQHGWGGHRKQPTIQTVKNAFLSSGFQTFIFDTTNSFGESDGDFEKSTLGQFAEDFEDVTKWVEKQEWFVGPLAVAGHSKGGFSVVRYAETFPDEVSYLVPVAPVVSGKLSYEVHEKYHPKDFEKWKTEGVLETTSKEGVVKRKHWYQMEERLNHDVLPEAHKLSIPTLLIVGSEDTSCPPEHIKMFFDAMPEGQKSMYIIEDAPHSYYEKHEQDECQRAIEQWLEKV